MNYSKPRRIFLKIAYDGTYYHGYQIQDNVETIEGCITKVIKELTDEEVSLIGGSRTDAGVHAISNVAVFDTYSSIPGDKFSYALNSRLPEDIRIVESREVDNDFHPRHCDSVKTYEYTIYNAKFPNPIERLYSHFSYTRFDVERMREAARNFEGEHDFTSFCTVGAQVDSKVRTIYSCAIIDETIDEDSRKIIIRISGNGFLYNMVRIIAGTLMEVGAMRIEPSDIIKIIEAKDRAKAGPTAPANGLMLVNYEFKNI